MQEIITLREPISDLQLVESDATNIRDIENQTVDLQLLAVEINPDSIRFIRQPLFAVQERAVELDPKTIRHIYSTASPTVRRTALEKDASVIRFLPDSTIEEQRFSIMQSDHHIEYIQNKNWRTHFYQMLYWYKILWI